MLVPVRPSTLFSLASLFFPELIFPVSSYTCSPPGGVTFFCSGVMKFSNHLINTQFFFSPVALHFLGLRRGSIWGVFKKFSNHLINMWFLFSPVTLDLFFFSFSEPQSLRHLDRSPTHPPLVKFRI